MNSNIFNKLFSFFSLLLLLSFFIIGGCDVDFGGTEDDDGGSGNNGNGNGSISETVEGTIVDVIPSRDSDVQDITAQIMDDDDLSTFTATTGASGFFEIDGNFAGTPDLEFLDDDNNDNSLGQIIINVFPGARVQLGDISLENGTIVLNDDTTVTFDADITDNDCSDNSGSIEVEIENDDGDDVDVLVQINNSTDIEDNDGDDINCEDLLVGQEIEVSGELLGIGNNVEADRIEQD